MLLPQIPSNLIKNIDKIHFVGNTMIDSLLNFKDAIQKSNILKIINCPKKYGIMTFHRPSNVDQKETLKELIKTIELCSEYISIVLPLHPRTRKNIEKFGFWERFSSIKGLIHTDSLGYLDFMKLVTNASIVVTDSGGIQEETTFLQIPCITVRENTERPITITKGSNELISLNSSKISSRIKQKLDEDVNGEVPNLWDGQSTERILDILSKKLE